MQIAVYGSGYLGTVISACLADFGTPVACYDEDVNRVAAQAEGMIPFYEKNLKDVLRRNQRAGRLTYTTDLAVLVEKAQVVFLAEDSYHYIEEVALKIARVAARDAVLVVATPVPV
ncbi:MAG TPA: 3-hydroxyacyl-CoA dehydrogenase NAD-binding domain-containing protein, partial [Terriglobales bacterium]|nr:3-hydroxyacyl-CoA dehydrogenase NAD-binding domain-containing protein [Terriglobales bacterium]